MKSWIPEDTGALHCKQCGILVDSELTNGLHLKDKGSDICEYVEYETTVWPAKYSGVTREPCKICQQLNKSQRKSVISKIKDALKL